MPGVGHDTDDGTHRGTRVPNGTVIVCTTWIPLRDPGWIQHRAPRVIQVNGRQRCGASKGRRLILLGQNLEPNRWRHTIARAQFERDARIGGCIVRVVELVWVSVRREVGSNAGIVVGRASETAARRVKGELVASGGIELTATAIGPPLTCAGVSVVPDGGVELVSEPGKKTYQ